MSLSGSMSAGAASSYNGSAIAWNPMGSAPSATPSFLGPAALNLQAAGAVGSTIGSFFSASGQKSALNAQANISQINAGLDEQAAESALSAGQKESQSFLLKGAMLKSTQRASMAANGIDLNGAADSSTINIQNSTDYMSQSDANTAAANAVKAAWGYRIQGTSDTNEALLKRTTASNINPFMSAGSTLLTGAKDLASSAYGLNKLGAIPKNSFWNLGG